MNGVYKYTDYYVVSKCFYFNGKKYGLQINKFHDRMRAQALYFNDINLNSKAFNPIGYITYDNIINKREIIYMFADYNYLCYIRIQRFKDNKVDIIHKNCLLP
jgi:hypothetical protein